MKKHKIGRKSKLSIKQISKIVELYLSGDYRMKDLAKKFNVGTTTISNYLSGWQVPPEWCGD